MEKKKDKAVSRSFSFVLVAFVFVLLMGVVILYSKAMHRMFQEETIRSVSEVSAVSAGYLERRIKEELYNLECIAAIISGDGKNDMRQMTELLRIINQDGKGHFKRLCVVDENGTAYLPDGTEYNIADREYYQLAMQGSANVSGQFADRLNGEAINVLAVPVFSGGQVAGVLAKVRANETYQEELEVKSFGDQGYSYVVKTDGSTVIASSQKTSFQNMQNIFTSLLAADERNAACREQLEAEMQKGRTGCITFYNKVKKYLYYRPVSIGGWYLLTVVPESVAGEKQDAVMKSTYILCLGIVLFLGGLMFSVLNLQIKSKKQLEKVLFVDPLTGGRSYEKFRRDAERVLSKQEKTNYAIVDIDIDKFKYINDSFGYEEGDRVLRFVWSTINRVAGAADICARKSSDEFAVLAQYEDEEELFDRITRFCEGIRKYQSGTNQQYEVIPSVGIYEIRGLKKEVDTMLDRAAIARKCIKGRRNTLYAIYDDTLRQRLNREKYIEDRMDEALKNREFTVYYQPKYNSITGKACGAEALVRWLDKNGGMVMPNEFIPISESNGFVTELDEFVFEQVCIKVREWLDAGKRIVPVSVNLSRVHLMNLNFIEEYVEIRDKYRIPEGLIQLELTESAMFEQEDRLAEVICQLHKSGFDVLMDDFGTGYSSLYMLKNVSVDVLKLDKRFVDDIGNSRGESVIDSIVKLAHSLHMKVTAEGVETGLQYEFLKKVSCDEIQGFYFSKPVDEKEYETILDQI